MTYFSEMSNLKIYQSVNKLLGSVQNERRFREKNLTGIQTRDRQTFFLPPLL